MVWTIRARSIQKQRTCQLLSVIYHHRLRSTRLAVAVVVVFLLVPMQSDGYPSGCVEKRDQRTKREVIDDHLV